MTYSIYLVYFLVGIINGMFSSGAGQILVFYMIYIIKKNTKESREFSLIIMPIVSVISFGMYYIKVKSSINNLELLILCIISVIFGIIGNKCIQKISSKVLNILSGILLVLITTINLWRMYL